ncbi:MAG: helix-turn-helix domain-containing protein [Microthrixaceae bacterium]
MSAQHVAPAPPPVTPAETNPRTVLSDRQQASVQALMYAATELVREQGYNDLTMRAVAARAGLTHTTAYAYFSSKAHLVAELFWRRLQAVDTPVTDPSSPIAQRVAAALGGPGLLLADEPALAQATLAALLVTDPEVALVRDAVGADLARRLAAAIGDEDADAAETLLLAFSGAMLQAGMGYFDFAGVVDRMVRVANRLDVTDR